MPRSLFSPFVVFALAVTILLGAGCGGGGGKGGSSSSSSGSTTGTIFSQQIVGTDPGSSTARSLTNLQVGERITLRSLALYTDSTGAYQSGGYVSVSNASIVADPSVATLSGTTLTAVGVGSGTVTLTGANGTIIGPVTFTISSNSVSVAGRVRTIQVNNSNPGVAYATVRFLDSTGAVVASSVTGPDGFYRAFVPTTAVTYQAVFDSPALIASAFYNQFTYGTLDYTAETAGCGVALGTLSSTSNLTLSDSIAYSRSSDGTPPPPPGSGCLSN